MSQNLPFWPITTHAEIQMSQFDFANLLEAGGKRGKTQMSCSRIGFGVTFDWLRKEREIFQSITKHNNAKPRQSPDK